MREFGPSYATSRYRSFAAPNQRLEPSPRFPTKLSLHALGLRRISLYIYHSWVRIITVGHIVFVVMFIRKVASFGHNNTLARAVVSSRAYFGAVKYAPQLRCKRCNSCCQSVLPSRRPLSICDVCQMPLQLFALHSPHGHSEVRCLQRDVWLLQYGSGKWYTVVVLFSTKYLYTAALSHAVAIFGKRAVRCSLIFLAEFAAVDTGWNVRFCKRNRDSEVHMMFAGAQYLAVICRVRQQNSRVQGSVSGPVFQLRSSRVYLGVASSSSVLRYARSN